MTSIQDGHPLKVAMFSNGAHPGDAVYELARDLVAEGAEVELFCLRRDGEPGFETLDGIRIYRTGPIHLDRPLRLRSSVAPKLPPQAYAHLRANPPVVVHAHGTSFVALAAGGVARLLKRPLVTTVYGTAEPASGLPRGLPGLAYERSLARALVRGSDRVICHGLEAAVRAARLGARPELTTVQDEAANVRETLAVYIDTLAERELRWFLQKQAA